jgi:ribosomal protein L19
LAETKSNRLTDYRVGDTVKVHFKIKEGNKERIQVFQGIVIQKKALAFQKLSLYVKFPVVLVWRGYFPKFTEY